MKSVLAPFLAGVFAAAPALAFVPGAEVVFGRFAEKQAADRTESGALKGRAWVPAVFGGGEAEVLATADIRLPGACGVRLELPDGATAAHLADGKVRTEGTRQAALAAAVALGCPLSTLSRVPAEQAEATLKRIARSLEVDTKVVSLSLFHRRPAYVVGAKPRQIGRPQIWFEKKSSRPTRVIASYEGQLWDVRLIDPASPTTGRRQPRMVEVWQGGERVLAVRFTGTGTGSADAPEDMDVTDED